VPHLPRHVRGVHAGVQAHGGERVAGLLGVPVTNAKRLERRPPDQLHGRAGVEQALAGIGIAEDIAAFLQEGVLLLPLQRGHCTAVQIDIAAPVCLGVLVDRTHARRVNQAFLAPEVDILPGYGDLFGRARPGEEGELEVVEPLLVVEALDICASTNSISCDVQRVRFGFLILPCRNLGRDVDRYFLHAQRKAEHAARRRHQVVERLGVFDLLARQQQGQFFERDGRDLPLLELRVEVPLQGVAIFLDGGGGQLARDNRQPCIGGGAERHADRRIDLLQVGRIWKVGGKVFDRVFFNIDRLDDPVSQLGRGPEVGRRGADGDSLPVPSSLPVE
jgi:hypothetical protein